MRSKSLAERPPRDNDMNVCHAAKPVLQTPGALSLVRGPETRTAAALKPGLY